MQQAGRVLLRPAGPDGGESCWSYKRAVWSAGRAAGAQETAAGSELLDPQGALLAQSFPPASACATAVVREACREW